MNLQKPLTNTNAPTYSDPTPVWICYTSGFDGRGPDRIISVHERKSDAEERKSGYVGVREGLGIVFSASDERLVYLIQDESPLPLNQDVDEAKKRIREKALAKLSLAERKALGISG